MGYRVELLESPVATPEGVTHGSRGARSLLPWSEVRWAVAAEVGEPQGVRTIVFDLVSRSSDGEWRAHRLDAEPGEDAMALARVVERGLGAGRKVPSIRSLAADGIPARWYPDLPSFEEDAFEELSDAGS